MKCLHRTKSDNGTGALLVDLDGMKIANARSVVVEEAIAGIKNELGQFVDVGLPTWSAGQVLLVGGECERQIDSDAALKAGKVRRKKCAGSLTKSHLMQRIRVVDRPVLEYRKILKRTRSAAHGDPDTDIRVSIGNAVVVRVRLGQINHLILRTVRTGHTL